jgi:hypothetical protein
VATVLVSPHFLFRVEPPGAVAGLQRVTDIELASRLSFFLWSSIPDEELLSLAERGELQKPTVLSDQVERMLADPRADALASNFIDQWLQLRNLEAATPNLRLFPNFDENLRRSFRRETQLLFMDVLRRGGDVLDLIQTDHTFLNERLAKHYEIPHVSGAHFRKVALRPDDQRGGILRHGSVLTVSSYATRTSPVLRGRWILSNLLGSPPPPPPDDVPALEENRLAANLSVRERLAAHRANPACASCHDLIDPIGFALERYDAVGRFREFSEGKEVDASAELFDGRQVDGVADLERAISSRPSVFAAAIAEKMLMFALGRTTDENDGFAIRSAVARAERDRFRLQSLIQGVVESRAFQFRGPAAGRLPPSEFESR